MATQIKKTKLPLTLIVGLGGTGCDIVARVDKLVNEEQRKYIRFVFVDTDANELRVRKNEAPYVFTIQTSRSMTVGQALRNDPESREDSFPVSQQLLNKPMTEGAGQVRAVSKLAFDATLREGRIKPLHDAINELQKLSGDEMEQAMRVVIVSTMVGGTGSGVFLPVSMYLRHYLETTCQKKPIIRGFSVLPDVFFHGANKTESEKNNLRANAYATLRELDAFMLKADSTEASELKDRYYLKMPRPGTVDQYDDYLGNPMDFCFLFDGQNIDGDSLQTFEEYKQHAADCIYASSISELHKRLNSSEDNTILERCAADGRNRYCGIGTSKIIYPFSDVRDYIALQWMKNAMTENWMRYDKLYEREVAKRQASRARGVLQPPVDLREFYCRTIAAEQSENNYFSFAIHEECYNKDRQGISFTSPRWESYYERLKEFIETKINEDTDYDEGITQKITEIKGVLQNAINSENEDDFTSNYPQLEQLLKALFTRTKHHAEATANITADSIFSPDNFDIQNEAHIEHWLTQDGVPLHPNAVRYFLYNLEAIFKEEYRRLTIESDKEGVEAVLGTEPTFADLSASIKDFFTQETYWIDEGTDNPRKVNITNYVLNLHRKRLGEKTGDKKGDLLDKARGVLLACNQHHNNITAYHQTYLRKAILEKALEYINRLASNYEFFFQQLEIAIKRIPRRLQKLETSYADIGGSPIMYACASKVCLNGLLERCPNTVDPIALTDDFRKKLFSGVFECMKVDEKKQKDTIDTLVTKDILDFWRTSVLDQYRQTVDMDVLDALGTQAELEEGIYELDDQRFYIERKRDAALKLAAPFIDRPIGREPYIIEAYAMAKDTYETSDAQKSILISQIFGSAERDDRMDKYQLVFMKALYNLRVSDLLKFARADESSVDPHGAGDYFKAYRARIDNILPDCRKTKILTPHLDKRWHYTGVLPDLDDETERQDIIDAQKAFFISIVLGKVRFSEDQYRFVNESGDFIDDTIVVSDGKCNKFHEIYDAMLISRPLVREMLDRYLAQVEHEKTEAGIGTKDYTNSHLYKRMKKLHLYASNSVPVSSFLELPLLYKASMGNATFKDQFAVELLQTFMNTVEEYLAEFYPAVGTRNVYFVKWLAEQADLMIDNIVQYYDNGDDKVILANPFSDILVNRIINNILGRFQHYETCDEAYKQYDRIEEKWQSVIAAHMV